MLKVITFNANGIRAAAKKGFFLWLAQQNADVVCIQETKAQKEQLSEEFFPFPFNYYHSAEKKGYSGVAIYARKEPIKIEEGIGWNEVDCEGRWLSIFYENLQIISLYMHSGTSGEVRQQEKEKFMAKLLPYLENLSKNGHQIILTGDINIAHTEKDLKNWKANVNCSGFLLHEREWLSELFSGSYKDAFRIVNQNDDEYSWWSQRSKTARINNVGWRIDYQIITNSLSDKVLNAQIYKDEVFSDHAPVIIEYDYSL
ncbi:MAG: exodeoxyribonuclease III [Cardiobacteriaceae bacterium]|nr:exodeoxyribonuclease III [Cardiobacteriaceae bacterium]